MSLGVANSTGGSGSKPKMNSAVMRMSFIAPKISAQKR